MSAFEEEPGVDDVYTLSSQLANALDGILIQAQPKGVGRRGGEFINTSYVVNGVLLPNPAGVVSNIRDLPFTRITHTFNYERTQDDYEIEDVHPSASLGALSSKELKGHLKDTYRYKDGLFKKLTTKQVYGYLGYPDTEREWQPLDCDELRTLISRFNDACMTPRPDSPRILEVLRKAARLGLKAAEAMGQAALINPGLCVPDESLMSPSTQVRNKDRES